MPIPRLTDRRQTAASPSGGSPTPGRPGFNPLLKKSPTRASGAAPEAD